ncbi:MAG TPA: peptide-methionine (R)-S-oxide reductase MsrB, partial [Chitinophagales bacterium]|nr:peptide-methionine (R)-S-oxide reductase MsrB [Chitinophagales bacterium]
MKNLLVIFANLLLLLNSCAQTTPIENHTTTASASTTNIPMKRTETEWKQQLNPEQYYILREKGTEPAFSGEFVFHKEKGVYKCAACGSELFTDDMKFPSHCGWPSFDSEITGGKIIQTEDLSHGMQRIEITCANCGGHLGHIFDDGPTATGKRYCVNSLSLSFEPANPTQNAEKSSKSEQITLGGGCFWCIEAIFEALKGVEKVESGYSGGQKAQPTYKEVCTGNTGHAEVIQLTF